MQLKWVSSKNIYIAEMISKQTNQLNNTLFKNAHLKKNDS